MMDIMDFSALQKPKLWEKSLVPFWDDEHISKGMLSAHIDPNNDAATRKLSVVQSSVEWLCTVLPKGARVLDIGCGPGMYTSRLAKRGYSVVGVDFSRRSIDYAISHDSHSVYLYQNYLDMDFCEEFDAVLLIYCDYAALIPDERRRLLDRVYRALKPDGVFIFDVFNLAVNPAVESKSWSLAQNGGFWSADPYLCLNASFAYCDQAVSADLHVVCTAQKTERYIIWNTSYTLNTLADELAQSNFAVSKTYGGVCGETFSPDSELICTLAKKVSP